MKRTSLIKNWAELMQPTPGGEHQFAALKWLLVAYQEPHRAYHTLNHLQDLVDQWEQHKAQLVQPIAVGLALWFHDCVYDSHRSDNEQASARMAQEWLSKADVSPSRIAQVAHLVLLTDGHQPVHGTYDEHWLLDADLSILGQESARYLQYAREIRKEYAFIPWPEYQSGRRAVLKRFLERPQLYFTEEYRDQYEEQARRNLQQEWETLDREEE
ncbi:MAG: hypothetical protein AAF399_16345 [Bacteroidota bacterium]